MEKIQAYKWSQKRIRAQVLRHQNLISTLANTSAILKEYFPQFFWVGFYFNNNDHLLLGPFQGPPACVRLTMDKGVCAACVKQKESIIVPNVHEFPGHVACDERSNSEIVVPVYDKQGAIRAILDIDSETLNDFEDMDREELEKIVELLQEIW